MIKMDTNEFLDDVYERVAANTDLGVMKESSRPEPLNEIDNSMAAFWLESVIEEYIVNVVQGMLDSGYPELREQDFRMICWASVNPKQSGLDQSQSAVLMEAVQKTLLEEVLEDPQELERDSNRYRLHRQGTTFYIEQL